MQEEIELLAVQITRDWHSLELESFRGNFEVSDEHTQYFDKKVLCSIPIKEVSPR